MLANVHSPLVGGGRFDYFTNHYDQKTKKLTENNAVETHIKPVFIRNWRLKFHLLNTLKLFQNFSITQQITKGYT